MRVRFKSTVVGATTAAILVLVLSSAAVVFARSPHASASLPNQSSNLFAPHHSSAALAISNATSTTAQTFPLDDHGLVDVDIPNGDIIVHTWNRLEVCVDNDCGTDKPNAVRVVTRNKNRLIVRTLAAQDANYGDERVNCALVVPRNASLELHTEDGDITVDGAGDVSGDALIAREPSQFEGRVSACTGSGRISVANVRGSVDIEASNGDVVLSHPLPLNENERIRCKTLDGRIDLTTHPESSFDLTINSVRSRISSDFPLTLQGALSSRTMMARVGDGGPDIVLDTLDGPIIIHSSAP